MLLIVVEDLLHALDTRIRRAIIVFLGVLRLIPIKNPADEGRDQRNTSFSTCNGLAETEEEGEVAVDLVVALEFAGGLDAFPGRRDLDKDALFRNTLFRVESDEVLGLGDIHQYIACLIIRKT